ncbi:hypothetical protein B0H17DRAFT_1135402 [Mycena rosella]|uniref:Uncharacterized protein n=1 Tax=Mycena rosella TaxID=1033263 RepID=A0AAD7GH81_MYCRO|nr:hypothetical protein B0H17DRAFT_1135402 [Mycena rosella]
MSFIPLATSIDAVGLHRRLFMSSVDTGSNRLDNIFMDSSVNGVFPPASAPLWVALPVLSSTMGMEGGGENYYTLMVHNMNNELTEDKRGINDYKTLTKCGLAGLEGQDHRLKPPRTAGDPVQGTPTPSLHSTSSATPTLSSPSLIPPSNGSSEMQATTSSRLLPPGGSSTASGFPKATRKSVPTAAIAGSVGAAVGFSIGILEQIHLEPVNKEAQPTLQQPNGERGVRSIQPGPNLISVAPEGDMQSNAAMEINTHRDEPLAKRMRRVEVQLDDEPRSTRGFPPSYCTE